MNETAVSHTYQCPADCAEHRGSTREMLTAPEQAAWDVAVKRGMNLCVGDIRALVTAAMQAQDQAGWRPAGAAVTYRTSQRRQAFAEGERSGAAAERERIIGYLCHGNNGEGDMIDRLDDILQGRA
jgi:hypothetical protein